MRATGAMLAFVVLALAGAVARPASAAGDPVVAAAGDIACGIQNTSLPCHEAATSDILANLQSQGSLNVVLPLGDVQYECGELSNFSLADTTKRGYDRSWGRFNALAHPVVGNHEYLTYPTDTSCLTTQTVAGAPGYFTYFGHSASPLDGIATAPCVVACKGYYSYDLGSWHVVALNSNCTKVSCAAGKAQETWLKTDLAQTTRPCILAYTHAPRFASNTNASSSIQPLWQDLYDAHVDVVVAAHAHIYERFAKLGRTSTSTDKYQPVLDPNGIREFVVGTGGETHMQFSTIKTGSEVRNNDTFGVLKLTLHAGNYDWQFLPESGKTFTDAGTASCNPKNISSDTQAPTSPTGLTATAPSSGQVNLSWNASSDNVGVTGYEIWRGPAGGSLTKIGTTSGTGTTYSDTTISAATSYNYAVKAFDAANNTSNPSNTATVTTPAAPAGISFVGQQDYNGSTSGTTQTLAYSGGSAGDFYVLLVATSLGATGNITAVTDSGGNTWTRSTQLGVSSTSNTFLSVWRTTSMKAVPGTITVTGIGARPWEAKVIEFSGVAAADAAAASQANSTATTSLPTPSTTISNAGSLLIAAGVTSTSKTANPSGWTALTDLTAQTPHLFSAFRLPGVTGTYSATWTIASAKSTGAVTSFLPAP